jgi:hypothetical protein
MRVGTEDADDDPGTPIPAEHDRSVRALKQHVVERPSGCFLQCLCLCPPLRSEQHGNMIHRAVCPGLHSVLCPSRTRIQ